MPEFRENFAMMKFENPHREASFRSVQYPVPMVASRMDSAPSLITTHATISTRHAEAITMTSKRSFTAVRLVVIIRLVGTRSMHADLFRSIGSPLVRRHLRFR